LRRPATIPAVGAVWALFGLVALEVLVTYARTPADELYHVSGTGAGAGLGRALVFLNFPVALAALPLLAFAADRLRGGFALATALSAAVLCAVVFWPGVVDQADLDARPVNALAAAGVALAVLLTAAAGLLRVPVRLHPAFVGLAAYLLVFATPWIAADLGFHLGGVPVLGTLWQTGELRHQPGVQGVHPAVHFGHHHGMDGVLLSLAVLATAPLVRAIRTSWLRALAGAYLGLELAYGLANALQDFWLEQVVKRGWTGFELPMVLRPELTFAWLGIALAAACFAALILGRGRV
jgi:hypothetical protein